MRVMIERIPEGGAIEDERSMSTDAYGELMRSRLGGEYRRFAESALAFSSPPSDGLVLELGPGPAWAGLMLLRRSPGLRLVGIDASADMVKTASVNAAREGLAERATYRLGTAEVLEGVEDGSVDLVISRDSLHHWADPRAAFASILRVLKPSGRFFLSDERRDLSLAAWAFVYVFGTLTMGGFARYWRSSIRAAYTPEELRAMLPPTPRGEWAVEEDFLDLSLRL